MTLGGDAALSILYDIAARTDCDAEDIRENLLVGVMPTQNPDGRELVPPFSSQLALACDDPSERGVSQFVLRLDNLSFRQAGRHSFDISADGEYIGSVELRVRVRATQAPPAAAPDA